MKPGVVNLECGVICIRLETQPRLYYYCCPFSSLLIIPVVKKRNKISLPRVFKNGTSWILAMTLPFDLKEYFNNFNEWVLQTEAEKFDLYLQKSILDWTLFLSGEF